MAQARVSGNFNPPADFLEDLDISQDVRAGEIEVSWDVTAFTTDELVSNYSEGVALPEIFARPGTETLRGKAPDHYDVEVSLSPSRLGNIRANTRNRLDDIASQAGIQVQILRDRAQDLGGSFNIPSITEETEVPIGTTASGSHVFTFDPIRVPVPEGQSVLDNIPVQSWPVMSITVRADAPVVGELVFGAEQKTYTQRIPPEAFIEEIQLDEGCGTLYANIMGDIDGLNGRVSSRLEGARSALDQLESQADTLLGQARSAASSSGSGGGSGGSTRLTPIDDGSDEQDSEPSRILTPPGEDDNEPLTDGGIPGSISQLASDIRGLSDREIAGGDFTSIRTRVEGIGTRADTAQDLRDEIDDMQDRIDNNVGSNCRQEILNRLNTGDLNQLESISSQAETLKNAILDALQNVESINCESAFSAIDSTISTIENSIGGGTLGGVADLGSGERDAILSDVIQAENRISSEMPSGSPCQAQFRSRLDDVRSQLESGGDQPVRDTLQELSCADVSGTIRSQVESVQSAIRNYSASDIVTRQSDRREELIDEVESAMSSVNRNVDDQNPCKRQLLSRLREAQSTIQATPARPQSAIPCEQRHGDIADQIDQFEGMVLGLTPPVGPERVQEIANQGNQIADTIDNSIEPDDSCRQEMTERVRNLVSRTRDLTPQVRIETGEGVSGEERRDELLENLLGSIDRLREVSNRNGDEEE